MLDLIPIPTLVPIERLALPAELDGAAGSNRAIGGRPQIAACIDLDALKAWLARVTDTPTTFASYRKEAERLLLWSVIELGKPLSSLTHEDLLVYQRFLADPQPTSRWVMKSGRKWARHDPEWRPFAGPLSPTSQRQAMVILNSLFTWLVNAGYLAGNPLALSRQRQRKAKPRITRYLDQESWQEVKAAIEAMPRETERDGEHYWRVRWLFSLLYLCGIRISEVVQNTMGDFFCRHDADGEDRWWLEITGKGDKTRLVPATGELMIELARYRRAVGRAPYPTPGETTPLLLPIGGTARPLTRSAVHLIVKTVFGNAAARVRAKGTEGEHRAAQIEAASAHWLRHTAGTQMVANGIETRNVRDNFGHESLETTNIYVHSEEIERHKETEEKHRLGW